MYEYAQQANFVAIPQRHVNAYQEVYVPNRSQKAYSSNCAGCNVLRTHSIFDGGQTRATILPLMSPRGIGPWFLESLDQGRLSPTRNM